MKAMFNLGGSPRKYRTRAPRFPKTDGLSSLRKEPKGTVGGDNAPRNPANAPGAGETSPSGGAPMPADPPDTGSDPGSSGGEGSGEAPSGSGAQQGGASGFDDYYNRLIAALRSYGVDMTLPTLEELYQQLSSFLRPSVDAAIANRRSYGDTVMAELDADAYSRGMGGSSYLSGMKNREYNAVASDIAAMESNYSASLARYLYNASNELQSIQLRFEQMRREQEYELQRERERRQHEAALQYQRQQHELALARLRAQSSGHSGSGSGSGSGPQQSSPQALSEDDLAANYNAYIVYMECISEQDRYNAFHSSDPYWQRIRSEMTSSLSGSAYARLRSLYDPRYGSGHGGGRTGTNPTVYERMTD